MIPIHSIRVPPCCIRSLSHVITRESGEPQRREECDTARALFCPGTNDAGRA